jgi:protein phosphatase
MNSSEIALTSTGFDTHVGCVRSLNEDALVAEPEAGLWVVADGVGGEAAGDLASRTAVAEIQAAVAAGNALKRAVRNAHKAILEACEAGRGRAGMGTTVVALRLREDAYEVAWVGDSRAYLYRAGALRQLTRDHSLVQDLVDQGMITASEARHHPRRNIITRALGGRAKAALDVDGVSGQARAGDVFLLCSDGLNGELEDACIRATLQDTTSPSRAAAALVQAALTAGGRDNVTAVVVAIEELSGG